MPAEFLDASFGADIGLDKGASSLVQPTSVDLRVALSQVLGLHRPGSTVSTRAAIKALRLRIPELNIGNDELVTIVADQAIARGLSIVFDSRDG